MKREGHAPAERPETGTAKNNAGFVPAQRLPYRSPALVEYGQVSKLTESTGSRNGDHGQTMMGCL
jgi:hypothetical protein